MRTWRGLPGTVTPPAGVLFSGYNGFGNKDGGSAEDGRGEVFCLEIEVEVEVEAWGVFSSKPSVFSSEPAVFFVSIYPTERRPTNAITSITLL
jgi:hypothetical protein